MQAGDRVKLTQRAATAMAKHYIRRARRVDWPSRRGTVTKARGPYAYVMWDGRKSFEQTLLTSLELAR